MKKDLIFTPILIALAVLLGLLKVTGLTAHIIISIIGVLVLVAYSVLSKKEWKIPVLEIIMRVLYGIALISGIIVMNVTGILILSIVHKASAVLFIILMIGLFVHKLIKNRK